MANRDSPFPCLSTFVLLTIDRPRAPVLVASQTALEYGEKEGRCADAHVHAAADEWNRLSYDQYTEPSDQGACFAALFITFRLHLVAFEAERLARFSLTQLTSY